MAQWAQMKQLIPYLPTQALNELYPNSFPMDVRCYLANWIEEQRWEDFDLEKVEQEPQALSLLDQITSYLLSLAQQNPNVVERMRLQHISRSMSMMRSQPLKLVLTVRDVLRKERDLLSRTSAQIPPHFPPSPAQDPISVGPSTRDVDLLVLKVLEIQNCRQQIHQLQEELNWERQNYESIQGFGTGTLQQASTNGMDTGISEVTKLQNNIKQHEYNGQVIAKKRVQLLQDAVSSLESCQSRLISRIKAWRWEQHQATIGHPFDDNLSPMQTWCEQLLGVNGKLRQEVMLAGEPIPELQDRLGLLLQTLIQSSLVVDKQPPQVIKTQSKFSTTVRYLLGEKVAPGKPVLLKAQIITEAQARNLGQLGSVPSENVGELINNTAILEHNTSSKSTCATFRNMSIKKIKRADRKGSESVTEEKFALYFTTEISITGCDIPYRIQMISVPVVVIVHGSQDNNALATIIWDCAFSEPDRIPFVVPERVPWKQMCMTLNSKFMSEVGTQRCLDNYNQHFLAQKIFDKPDIAGDYSNMLVSWAQFSKEVLPGRPFTFWQWFDGVIELTKKHLKSYWSDGLIFGFIGKQHLHLILKDRPNGTFLLRFSDSEIGGITIAYVAPSENGGQKIQNIQPSTKRDLEIRSLGDRIRDIDFITHVYPDLPKNDVFRKYYTDNPLPSGTGYLAVSIQTRVGVRESHCESPQRSDTPQDNCPFFAMDQGNTSATSPFFPVSPQQTFPSSIQPVPVPMPGIYTDPLPDPNRLFSGLDMSQGSSTEMELEHILNTFVERPGEDV
ncbi:signal transducer and activator of transcription 6 isoform X1 [Esox lucius]|uniref:signal transducer and activator of transcription 6 isoform X1 n=1 Tax=Esox lucius TaxID=8010 RepID=UPI000661C8CB|nr:signal transducer and activator of transcription 6 isoform X1 [Esox lucius]XP_012991813.1 signal transducer and activator of transcription 6 isoform X1 [Esox lucius]XP_012991814.1 signal transducer and activator of transcription 6 isoform X1 [Esox lucius]XP_012991815.1 signal transducer and activator of transcription 6 isoform X1 [Esox lucius]XP_019907106.1 signal transducer and activator of transcription 6 isoform X1 [Esox lucius]